MYISLMDFQILKKKKTFIKTQFSWAIVYDEILIYLIGWLPTIFMILYVY